MIQLKNNTLVCEVTPIQHLAAMLVKQPLYFNMMDSSLSLEPSAPHVAFPLKPIDAYKNEPFVEVHSFDPDAIRRERASDFDDCFQKGNIVIVGLGQFDFHIRFFKPLKHVMLTVFDMKTRTPVSRPSSELVKSSILYQDGFLIYANKGVPFVCGEHQTASEFKKWVNLL